MPISGAISRRIFSTAAFLFIAGPLVSQISSSDTADYLPLFYENALEYNLMIAASKGLDSEVERLILKGAEVDAQTSDGSTALIFAIVNIKPSAVITLLSYNANPNLGLFSSESPLMLTLSRLNELEATGPRPDITQKETDCIGIAESLIRYGADIDYQNNKGVTALNYAAAYGNFRFTDLLLYYRADIDRRDNEGTTPLMSAIWSGYANIADLLIQNGANLEARDKDGFTPFLIAAQNGDTLMLRYLADEGVDIYETCGDGWDALSICIRYNHIDAVRMLLRAGDKWNDPERKSYNHYRVAARYGRNEVIGILEKNNFPDSYRERLSQLELSLSLKASPSDIYTGMTFMLREPRVRMGWIAGFDTKLWYTRVMVQHTENLLYQYRDKSSVAYAGIFKDIPLTDNPMRSNFIFTGSLCAGYWFADKFKGTDTSPDSKFMILPAATIKWTKNNFSVHAGIEYMNTDFYRDWPVWLRTGISYNFDFEFGKTPVKIIKWY